MKKHLTKSRIIFYLFYLSLACTLVMGVTYARFTSQVTGTASARTAAVALDSSLDLSSQLQGLKPGKTIEIAFDVTNFSGKGTGSDKLVSEVAQEYSITINTTGNLPLNYEITCNNGSSSSDAAAADVGSYVAPPSEGDSNIWTGGFLPTGAEATHRYTLKVTWPKEKNDYLYSDEIDLVTLKVDAYQALPQTAVR